MVNVAWTPGRGLGLVWSQGAALIGPHADAAQARRLWLRLAEDEAGVPEFLEALSADTGLGLLQLPPFAVAFDNGDSMHVAARGHFEVRLLVSDGPGVVVSGADVSTWSEKRLALEMLTGVEIALVDESAAVDGDDAGDRWVTLGGLVPADSIAIELLDDADSAESTPQPRALLVAAPVAAPVVAPVARAAESNAPEDDEPADEFDAHDDEPDSEQDDEEPDAYDAEPEPQADEPDLDDEEPEAEPELAEPDELEAPDELDDPEPARHRARSNETLYGFDEDEADEAELAEPEPEPDEAPSGGSGRFASLFSDHTIIHDIESAAVRPLSEEEQEAADAAAPAPAALGDPIEVAHDAPLVVAPDVTPAPSGVGDGFISMVPPTSAAGAGLQTPQPVPATPTPTPTPTSASPATPAPASYDDSLVHLDGMTVVQLPDAAGSQAPAAPAPDSGGAGLLGVLCPVGHGNPPHRTDCRVCGAPVTGQPSRMPRPALGWLHTSAGEAIKLETNILAGRAPRAERFQGTELPRLLSLPHGHVSGTHLEIRLDGWSVMAVDLRSTNGTFLQRPGQPTMRLGEMPQPLATGDVLNLGHGVTLRFEELP